TRMAGSAAVGEEALPGVPMKHVLGFREWRQMVRLHQALNRDRAQVDDVEGAACPKLLGILLRETEAKARGAINQAEKYGLDDGRQRACLVRRECRLEAV